MGDPARSQSGLRRRHGRRAGNLPEVARSRSSPLTRSRASAKPSKPPAPKDDFYLPTAIEQVFVKVKNTLRKMRAEPSTPCGTPPASQSTRLLPHRMPQLLSKRRLWGSLKRIKIDPYELVARSLCGERPMDASAGGVALRLPGVRIGSESILAAAQHLGELIAFLLALARGRSSTYLIAGRSASFRARSSI
jgi:hypothetical protein